MKINKFKCVAVLGLAVLLSSCGGGGGSSSVSVPADGGGENPPVTNENGDDLSKALPFVLNKPNGVIASFFGFGALVGAIPQVAHVQHSSLSSRSVFPEGEPENPANPIYISSFVEPECSSGGIDFSENTPPTPVRLREVHPWPRLKIVEVNARKCRLGDNGLLIDGIRSDRNEFTKGDEISTNVYSSELTNYLSGRSVADSYSITGSVYSSQADSRNSDDAEIDIKVPHLEYVHAAGVNLVVSDLVYSLSLNGASDITTIQAYSYNVKWNIPEGLEADFMKGSPYTILVGPQPKKNFPPGEYNLSVLVTSPLVYNPDVNSSWLYASAGSVTVNLLSHNMKAGIVYHQGYADVTYSSLEGGIKQVRINADGGSEIISP